MALESAAKISELVDTNPAGTDQKAQGDDHLRMIKTVLQVLVTQAVAEDSADTDPAIWSPERVHQAVAQWVADNPTELPVSHSMKMSKGATQSIGAGATTQITWPTTDWDQKTWIVGNTYVPQEVGIYQVTCVMEGATTAQMELHARKNSTTVATQPDKNGEMIVTALINMNGTTDAIDIAVTNNSGSGENVGGDVTTNYLNVHKVNGDTV